MATKKEITFEKALERLEQIVASLESGESELDKSLTLFEEGVKLVKLCNEKLDNAESVVKKLVNCDGEFIETNFEVEDKNED